MQDTFVYNPPKEPFLDILYHDEDIIVVNKPSGLLSVPGKSKECEDSILYRVRTMHKDAFAVHRLDMGTSGILVVGLNKNAISKLGIQFQDRLVKKVYIAYVDGLINEKGFVDLPMRTDINNRPYQIIDFENGRSAYTDYERLYYDKEKDRSLVKLLPRTGRSHQLRVHMKELGHAILGDHLYASEKVFKCVDYLHLHAALLEFKHPCTNETMQYMTKPPFSIPDSVIIDKSWLLNAS